jgi:hypothetical protein
MPDQSGLSNRPEFEVAEGKSLGKTWTVGTGGRDKFRALVWIPACVGMTGGAYPSISAVTCAATERDSPSRS